MQEYRPDRVVRVLAAVASFMYFGALALSIIVFIGSPILKATVGNDPDWTWGLEIPATISDAAATVNTRWGPARLVIEDVRGDVRIPLGMLPWGLFALLWLHAAVAVGLVIAALHHLRRIFQRVRAGAPFDADNALRLRRVGLMLLGLALLNGVAELITSIAVRRGISGDAIGVPMGFHVNPSVVLFGLVLVALAEIFRRGAELETEQALVV